MLGVFMGALDNAILAPALPAIAEDLKTGVERITLAFSIYSVFYAVAVPILGRLSDLWGYGRIYGLSMALFAGGSALAALSQSLEMLVLARVVQAVGAGGLLPVAQAIVGVVAPEERRGAYLGQILGVFALALAHLGLFWAYRPWVPLFLALGGFGMISVLINANTLVQLSVPDRLRGRVMAVYSLVMLGTGPLGAYLTGLLFELLGGRLAALALGGLVLLVGLYQLRPWPKGSSPRA
jgi:MFS family permease